MLAHGVHDALLEFMRKLGEEIAYNKATILDEWDEGQILGQEDIYRQLKEILDAYDCDK